MLDPTIPAEVREVWRYPVKSMQGEQVSHIDVTANGLVGDRAFAVVDAGSGRTLTAKTVAALLDARARHDGAGRGTSDAAVVVVTLPDGSEHVAGDPATDDALSEWLGRAVRCERASASTHTSYDMTFDPPNDDAERFEIPSPDGTFFDLAALHVLTTNALAACAETAPDTVWDRRRFRPNLLVDVPAAPGTYPEDAWVGHHVRAGSAVLDVLMRTVRCAMPLRAQPAHGPDLALARDIDVFRTMNTVHDNHLGVYANVASAGAVAVGDTVAVHSP